MITMSWCWDIVLRQEFPLQKCSLTPCFKTLGEPDHWHRPQLCDRSPHLEGHVHGSMEREQWHCLPQILQGLKCFCRSCRQSHLCILSQLLPTSILFYYYSSSNGSCYWCTYVRGKGWRLKKYYWCSQSIHTIASRNGASSSVGIILRSRTMSPWMWSSTLVKKGFG